MEKPNHLPTISDILQQSIPFENRRKGGYPSIIPIKICRLRIPMNVFAHALHARLFSHLSRE